MCLSSMKMCVCVFMCKFVFLCVYFLLYLACLDDVADTFICFVFMFLVIVIAEHVAIQFSC